MDLRIDQHPFEPWQCLFTHLDGQTYRLIMSGYMVCGMPQQEGAHAITIALLGLAVHVLILAALSSTCLLEKLKAGKRRCTYVIQALGVCGNIVNNAALTGLLPERIQHDFMPSSTGLENGIGIWRLLKVHKAWAAQELFPAQWNRMHSLLGSSLKAGVIAMDNLIIRSSAQLRQP